MSFSCDLQPLDPNGRPLYFSDEHNAWFERKLALPPGTVQHAYRVSINSSAQSILDRLEAEHMIYKMERERNRRQALPFAERMIERKEARLRGRDRPVYPFGSVSYRDAVQRENENLKKSGFMGSLPFENQRPNPFQSFPEVRRDGIEVARLLKGRTYASGFGQTGETTDDEFPNFLDTDDETGSLSRCNAAYEPWINTGSHGFADMSGPRRSNAVFDAFSNIGSKAFARIPGFGRSVLESSRPRPARRSFEKRPASEGSPSWINLSKTSPKAKDAATRDGKISPRKAGSGRMGKKNSPTKKSSARKKTSPRKKSSPTTRTSPRKKGSGR